jgi:hypothetical protein
MSVEQILREYLSFAQEVTISEIARKVREAVKAENAQDSQIEDMSFPRMSLVNVSQKLECAN